MTFHNRSIGGTVALHTRSGVITTRLIKLVRGISGEYWRADSMIECAAEETEIKVERARIEGVRGNR